MNSPFKLIYLSKISKVLWNFFPQRLFQIINQSGWIYIYIRVHIYIYECLKWNVIINLLRRIQPVYNNTQCLILAAIRTSQHRLIDVKAIFSHSGFKTCEQLSCHHPVSRGCCHPPRPPVFFPVVKSNLLHLQWICMPPHLLLVEGSRRATMLCWMFLCVCVVLCECLRVHAVCAHHGGLRC